MSKELLNIQSGNIETGETEIEIIIKSHEKDKNEVLLKAIETLIESVDLDVEEGESSIARILYVFADHIGFNGWYNHAPNVTIKYEENSEEGYVTELEKISILKSYLNIMLEQNKSKN